jgi:hypothetical protein
LLAITGIKAAMLEGLSKRDVLSIIGGVIVLVVVGSFGGVYLAKYLIGDRSSDPLSHAGAIPAK